MFTPRKLSLVLAVAVVAACMSGAYGQAFDPPTNVDTDKRAQTGMKFLQVSASPRAAAMANTIASQTNGNSSSLFYNPASMAEMTPAVHAQLARTNWIVDMDYDFASVAYKPGTGQYGVVGASLVNVDYGDFHRVVRADNDQGYSRIGSYRPSALGFGVGYARSFTDRFSAGAQIKYVTQSLGTHATAVNEDDFLVMNSFEESVLAYDFGVLYRTGFESLTLGMHARNFAPEVTYVRQSFELPLTFDIGISMDVLDLTSLNQEMHALQVHTSFNRPRDFAEQVQVGGEYTFMNTVSVRAGWSHPTDEQGINLGAGLQTEYQGVSVGFDYAYTEFGIFDTVNRFGLRFGL